jgi:hypothetical protein
LNIEAQEAALNSFKEQKTTKRTEKGTSHYKKRSRSLSRENTRRVPQSQAAKPTKKSKRYHRPAESQPAAQIAPRIYLGAALRNVGRSGRSSRPSTPSSSSSGPSSDSSDGSLSSNPSGDSTPASEQTRHPHRRRRDNQHGRNRRRRRSSSSPSVSVSIIKPIPPKEYNGAADVRSYHRFVRESDAYIRDGKVRGR